MFLLLFSLPGSPPSYRTHHSLLGPIIAHSRSSLAEDPKPFLQRPSRSTFHPFKPNPPRPSPRLDSNRTTRQHPPTRRTISPRYYNNILRRRIRLHERNLDRLLSRITAFRPHPHTSTRRYTNRFSRVSTADYIGDAAFGGVL